MASPYKRLRHPHHLKRLYVVWRLRILRHAHSGKRVHHQHTSYPLLALILMATGVVLVQSTLSTYASDKMISAVVSGAPPTVAATIDSPSPNEAFTQQPIDVSGTCPVNTYVELFRNNYASGMAYCTGGGTYSIRTDLFSGANVLIARVYNLAGQAGPDSATRTVSFTPPATNDSTPAVQGTETPSESNPTNASAQPLTLQNDYTFKGYNVGDEASWQVAIAGGTAPYAVNVAWGDGTTALYTSRSADTLTLSHTYTRVSDQGSYSIIVSATDADGASTMLQLFALVTDNTSNPAVATGGTTGDGDAGDSTVAKVWKAVSSLWAVYGAAVVIVSAFWLGELRELRLIRARFHITK